MSLMAVELGTRSPFSDIKQMEAQVSQTPWRAQEAEPGLGPRPFILTTYYAQSGRDKQTPAVDKTAFWLSRHATILQHVLFIGRAGFVFFNSILLKEVRLKGIQ